MDTAYNQLTGKIQVTKSDTKYTKRRFNLQDTVRFIKNVCVFEAVI